MAKKKKYNKHSAVPKREFNPQNDSVRAKKYLGQHFLIDETIANDISQTLQLEGYKNVLEIGAWNRCNDQVFTRERHQSSSHGTR